MTKLEDWLEAIPSPNTRKSYEHGIKKFEEFYDEDIESLIGSKNAGKVIEKFYVWLKERYSQNTCRNYVNAPIQFLKYFGTSVNYRKSLGMFKTIPTTRDHRITIRQVQEMAKVSDLREQVLLEVFLLGLRIGDVSKLKWKTFDVSGDTPIPIEIMTEKEDVVARAYVSEEFKQLLEKYLENIDKENPYLFQSKRSKHLSRKRINAILKELGERANIKSHGLFRWHIGRKLFLRTCAELGVNQWSAKMLCGKSVSADIATYVNGASLKQDFEKINKVLRLFPEVTNEKTESLKEAIIELEKENKTLRTRIKVLQEKLDTLDKTIHTDIEERLIWLENKLRKKEKVILH